jgi:hypothetical protein
MICHRCTSLHVTAQGWSMICSSQHSQPVQIHSHCMSTLVTLWCHQCLHLIDPSWKHSTIMSQLKWQLWMCIRFMIHFSLSIHSFSFYKGRDVVVSTHNIYTSSLPTPSLFIGGEMLWYPPTTSIHHTSYRTSHRTSCHTSYRTSHRISYRTSYVYHIVYQIISHVWVMWHLPVVSTCVWLPVAIWLWYATSVISHCSLTQSL